MKRFLVSDILREVPVIISEEAIDEVDIRRVPGAWSGVAYHDLVQAAKGFLLWGSSQSDATLQYVEAILKTFACGYAHDHYEERASSIVICDNDPDVLLKRKVVCAIDRIRALFGDRLPWQFYFTLLVLGTREDPRCEVSILTIKDILQIPWSVADGMMHAAQLATPLWEQIQSIMCKETDGYRFKHGCDCACATPYLEEGGVIRAFPYGTDASLNERRAGMLVDDTYSFLKHALTQTLVLAERKLPFVMGAGVKAKKIGHKQFMERKIPV
jgi:hypothetical protein